MSDLAHHNFTLGVLNLKRMTSTKIDASAYLPSAPIPHTFNVEPLTLALPLPRAVTTLDMALLADRRSVGERYIFFIKSDNQLHIYTDAQRFR